MTHSPSLPIYTRPCVLSSQKHFSFQPLLLFFIPCLSAHGCRHCGSWSLWRLSAPFALLPGVGLSPVLIKTAKKCINRIFWVETRLLFGSGP